MLSPETQRGGPWTGWRTAPGAPLFLKRMAPVAPGRADSLLETSVTSSGERDCSPPISTGIYSQRYKSAVVVQDLQDSQAVCDYRCHCTTGGGFMGSRGLRGRWLLLVISALILTPTFAHESWGEDNKMISRVEAVKGSATIDCGKITPHSKNRRSFPREKETLAVIGTPIKLNDESAPADLTAGVWSPSGESVAFVAPTKRTLPLKRTRGEGPVAVGVSVNEIWLYRFSSSRWERVSEDGARPRFSQDGKRLFYLSSTEGARAVDMTTLVDEPLGVPAAGDPNLRFHTEVLSDGSVLVPDQPDGVLKHRAALNSSWPSLELGAEDMVKISPDEQRLLVIYTATESNPQTVVVFNKAGEATTVLKNCSQSALHVTWSQDGGSLIYPMYATGQPEVWLSSLSGGQPETKVRLQATEGLGSVSLSPDNRAVAFSYSASNEKESLWIATSDGRQRVTNGLLGTWSPQGDRILYAVRRAGGGLSWYVAPVSLR